MSSKSSVWEEFLTKLQEKEGKTSVLSSILKQLKPKEVKEDKIIIGCQSFGIKTYLDKRINLIEEKFFSFFNKKINIEFVVLPVKKSKKDLAPLLSFKPSIEDIFSKAGLNKKYSFENFAVSSTNQVAFAAAQAVVNNPGSAYNPLFLYGGVGVGKTHLAQAIGRKILENDKEKKVLFCPGDNFINELIESIREKTTNKFRKKYRHLDLLIIDDIQFIAGKIHVQEEFFHTFNTIVSSGGQVILTSDRPPYEIKNLEDRLRSRFSGGLIVDIQPPDFELRTAILLIKSKEKNININIEAAKIIADKITDSRALEGVLLSIYARILGKKEEIDIEDVDHFFNSNKNNHQIKKITPSEVIKTICDYYNIRISQLKSQTRQESIALTRQITMYILRKYLNLKLTEIAQILKRKDHTTVLHGEKKIFREMIKNPSLKKDIDNIIQTLGLST